MTKKEYVGLFSINKRLNYALFALNSANNTLLALAEEKNRNHKAIANIVEKIVVHEKIIFDLEKAKRLIR